MWEWTHFRVCFHSRVWNKNKKAVGSRGLYYIYAVLIRPLQWIFWRIRSLVGKGYLLKRTRGVLCYLPGGSDSRGYLFPSHSRSVGDIWVPITALSRFSLVSRARESPNPHLALGKPVEETDSRGERTWLQGVKKRKQQRDNKFRKKFALFTTKWVLVCRLFVPWPFHLNSHHVRIVLIQINTFLHASKIRELRVWKEDRVTHEPRVCLLTIMNKVSNLKCLR